VKKNKDPNCLINDLYNFCMTCSSGFYISAGNCQLADQLCATFDASNGNCLSCYDGYRLNLGKCYLNNPILNCKMFNGNICSVCEDNYFVGKDGSCIHSWLFLSLCLLLLNNIILYCTSSNDFGLDIILIPIFHEFLFRDYRYIGTLIILLDFGKLIWRCWIFSYFP